MPEPLSEPPLTATEYFAGGQVATVRPELVNGAVVATTGATKMHNDQDILQP